MLAISLPNPVERNATRPNALRRRLSAGVRKQAVIALRGDAHHCVLRIGKLDGHELTLRVDKGLARPLADTSPDRKRSPGPRNCRATHAPTLTYTLSFEANARVVIRLRYGPPSEVRGD